MSDSSDEDCYLSLAELKGSNAELSSLPEKSRFRYLKTYTVFEEWRVSKGANDYSEQLILSYIEELSKTKQPTTIWSVYSMLKATLKIKQNIHIEKYPKLLKFLAKCSAGYKPKKSKIFTSENVEMFVKEAPDYEYLATKVGLIIGVCGACRSKELLKITIHHIKKYSDDLMLVIVPDTKSNVNRSCMIRGENYVKAVEKYKALRPSDVQTDRFFLKYNKGKCVRQPMGINKVGTIPRQVASFLNLPNPHLYTGHCFRRTSSTILVPNLGMGESCKEPLRNTEDCLKKPIEKTSKISDIMDTISFDKLENVWITTDKKTNSKSSSALVSPTMEIKIEYLGESDDNSKETDDTWNVHTVVTANMSKKTALNDYPYRGLVEARSIPAELHVRADGRQYASFGSVVPIHCCTPEEVKERAETTHHYCDIFTEQVLAPLSELAYVRLDENTAEKVFINRNKRLLITSSDGQLAQWRAAPSFESSNNYLAGTPVVNKDGALVSVVTARKGNHYSVSNIEGDGGYFATVLPWTVVETPAGHLVYGDRTFPTRDELRAYIQTLPPAEVGPSSPPKPVLQYTKDGAEARIALVAQGGRQLSHAIIQHVVVAGVMYL